MVYRILRLAALIIYKIFFGFEIKGRENIPQSGGFILASNHVSHLDPVVLGCALSRRLDFMAREDLFSVPGLSWVLLKVGAFPVKRNSADLSALKGAINRLRNGKGLVLFPEGTRQAKGSLSGVQPGIGFLAAKVGVPVVPALIKGTDTALPKGAKFIRPAKISVCFGKQIFVERRMPYRDIAQHIMDNIRHLSCSVLN